MPSRNQRFDVQLNISRTIELMQRPQGASVREICTELDCTPKTFYRNLKKMDLSSVPYFTKPDPDGATNAVRYYIQKDPIKGSSIFLTSAEKALLRMMVQDSMPLLSDNEESRKLLEKLNQGITHDTRDTSYIFAPEHFSLQQKWDYSDSFTLLAEALEQKYAISFDIDLSDYKPSSPFPVMIKHLKDFARIQENIIFEPYTIYNNAGTFYAAGHVTTRLPFITLPYDMELVPIQNLHNIRKIKNSSYSIPSDYSFQKTLDYFTERTQSTQIILQVNPDILHKIIHSSSYFPKTVYPFLNSINVVLQADSTGMDSLKTLILSNADKIKVLQPPSLIKEIQDKLNKAASLYTQDQKPDFFTATKSCTVQDEVFNHYTRKETPLLEHNLFWWRKSISSDNEGLNYSLYEFPATKYSRLLKVCNRSTSAVYYRALQSQSSNGMHPYTILIYEDFIACEFPLKETLDSSVFSMLNGLRSFVAHWNEITSENILSDYAPELLDRKEIYCKNKPVILFTAINGFSPDIAKEISRTHKLQTQGAEINCEAIILYHQSAGNNTITIDSYLI